MSRPRTKCQHCAVRAWINGAIEWQVSVCGGRRGFVAEIRRLILLVRAGYFRRVGLQRVVYVVQKIRFHLRGTTSSAIYSPGHVICTWIYLFSWGGPLYLRFRGPRKSLLVTWLTWIVISTSTYFTFNFNIFLRKLIFNRLILKKYKLIFDCVCF